MEEASLDRCDPRPERNDAEGPPVDGSVWRGGTPRRRGALRRRPVASVWSEPTSRRSHARPANPADGRAPRDRKSTRLNSSHLVISYAVFCLKKKKKQRKKT